MLTSKQLDEPGPGEAAPARWFFGRRGTLFQLIARALSKPAKPRLPHAAIDPEAVETAVSQRSHGNVRLQNKLFYTKKDVDERYERIRGVSFVD